MGASMAAKEVLELELEIEAQSSMRAGTRMAST